MNMQTFTEVVALITGPFGALILLLVVLVVFVVGLVRASKSIKTILEMLITEFRETNNKLVGVNERQSEEHKAEIARLHEHHKEDISRCQKNYEDMKAEVTLLLRDSFRRKGD